MEVFGNSMGLFSFVCTLNATIFFFKGGYKGFDKVVWEVVEHKKGEHPSVTFKYHSRDGEEGIVLSSL